MRYMEEQTDQWNRTESSEIQSSIKFVYEFYGKMILDKGKKLMQDKRTVFSINATGATGYPQAIERSCTTSS